MPQKPFSYDDANTPDDAQPAPSTGAAQTMSSFSYDDAASSKPAAKSNFRRGVETALRQVPQTAGGALALAGDAIGADGVRDFGMKVYKGQEDAIQAQAQPSDSFTNVLQGTGNVGDFLGYGAGYVGGQAATALATGGLGGVIGKQVARRGIAGLAAEQIAAREAAGQATGQAIGLGGYNYMQEAGSIYPDAVEQAQKEGRTLDKADLARVAGAAGAAAAVETLTDTKMLKGVFEGASSAPTYLRRAASAVPRAIGREASTEAVQTGIERVGSGQSLTDEDAVRDYVDSAALGGLGGGLGGAASAIVRHQDTPAAAPGQQDLTTSPGAAPPVVVDPNAGPVSRAAALLATPAGQPFTPNWTTAPGAAAPTDPNALDMPPREFATGDLSLVDPATQLRLAAPNVQVGPDGTATTGDQRHAQAQLDLEAGADSQPGPLETGAMGQGRNSELVSPRQLPPPTVEVGPDGEATTPEQRNARAQQDLRGRALRQQDNEERASRGLDPIGEDGSILDQGAPFKTRIKAQQAAKRNGPGFDLHPVDGGYVLRRSDADVTDVEAKTSSTATSTAASTAPSTAPAPTQPETGTGQAPAAPLPLPPNEEGAHQSHSSPLNDKTATKDQILGGNAPLGHMKIGGMGASIENTVGSTREDKHNTPPDWSTPMVHGFHYGYFKRTEGADSTEAKRQGLDAFIKAGTPEDYNGPVTVVDQVHKDGTFDEHKAIVADIPEAEARAVYQAHYEPGWQGLGATRRFDTFAEFKKWAKDGRKSEPANPEAFVDGKLKAAPADAAAAPAGQAGVQPAGSGADHLAGPQNEAAPAPVTPETAARYGRNGTPIADGGLPFKTKLAAIQQQKNQPGTRIVQHEGGFALRDLTDAERTAQTENSKKRQNAARSASWEKNPLLLWLADRGLFHVKDHPKSLKAEFSPDRNPFVGGGAGPVFRSNGKQIDALVPEAVQDGFLPQGADERDLEQLVHRVMRGERVAPLYGEGQAEAEAERRAPEPTTAPDDLGPEFGELAQHDASDPFDPHDLGLDDSDLEAAGYATLSPQDQADFRALVALASSRGIDTDTILEDADANTRNQPDTAYYEAARAALEEALAGRDQRGSQGPGQQGQARGPDHGPGEEGASSAVAPVPAPSPSPSAGGARADLDAALQDLGGVLKPEAKASPAPAPAEAPAQPPAAPAAAPASAPKGALTADAVDALSKQYQAAYDAERAAKDKAKTKAEREGPTRTNPNIWTHLKSAARLLRDGEVDEAREELGTMVGMGKDHGDWADVPELPAMLIAHDIAMLQTAPARVGERVSMRPVPHEAPIMGTVTDILEGGKVRVQLDKFDSLGRASKRTELVAPLSQFMRTPEAAKVLITPVAEREKELEDDPIDAFDYTLQGPNDWEILQAAASLKPGMFINTHYGTHAPQSIKSITVTGKGEFDGGPDVQAHITANLLSRPGQGGGTHSVFLRKGQLYDAHPDSDFERNEKPRYYRVYVTDEPVGKDTIPGKGKLQGDENTDADLFGGEESGPETTAKPNAIAKGREKKAKVDTPEQAAPEKTPQDWEAEQNARALERQAQMDRGEPLVDEGYKDEIGHFTDSREPLVPWKVPAGDWPSLGIWNWANRSMKQLEEMATSEPAHQAEASKGKGKKKTAAGPAIDPNDVYESRRDPATLQAALAWAKAGGAERYPLPQRLVDADRIYPAAFTMHDGGEHGLMRRFLIQTDKGAVQVNIDASDHAYEQGQHRYNDVDIELRGLSVSPTGYHSVMGASFDAIKDDPYQYAVDLVAKHQAELKPAKTNKIAAGKAKKEAAKKGPTLAEKVGKAAAPDLLGDTPETGDITGAIDSATVDRLGRKYGMVPGKGAAAGVTRDKGLKGGHWEIGHDGTFITLDVHMGGTGAMLVRNRRGQDLESKNYTDPAKLEAKLKEFSADLLASAAPKSAAVDEVALRKELDDIGQRLDRGKGTNPGTKVSKSTEAKLRARMDEIKGLLQAADQADAADVTADNVVNGEPRAQDLPPEQSLLMMPCSDGKLAEGGRADQVYTGPLWQTLRSNQPATMPQLAILSAKHGFMDAAQHVAPYDEKLNAVRVGQLVKQAPEIAAGMKIDGVIRDVQITGGADYRTVMRAVVAELVKLGKVDPNASIRETTGVNENGKGPGVHRNQLAQYLAGFQEDARFKEHGDRLAARLDAARQQGLEAGQRGDPRDPPTTLSAGEKVVWRAGWDQSKATKKTPQVPAPGAPSNTKNVDPKALQTLVREQVNLAKQMGDNDPRKAAILAADNALASRDFDGAITALRRAADNAKRWGQAGHAAALSEKLDALEKPAAATPTFKKGDWALKDGQPVQLTGPVHDIDGVPMTFVQAPGEVGSSSADVRDLQPVPAGFKPPEAAPTPSDRKNAAADKSSAGRESVRALADRADAAGATNLANRLRVLADSTKASQGKDGRNASYIAPAQAKALADKFDDLLARAKLDPQDEFRDVTVEKVGRRPSPEELKAKADLMGALGDLGSLLHSKAGGKLNITPEQEQALVPILARVFDAAFRLGAIKFKTAAKYVLEQIREALGEDVADLITIDHLQGAYISMSGKYRAQGSDTAKTVTGVESKAEIESEPTYVPGSTGDLERDSGQPTADAGVGTAVPGEPVANGGDVGDPAGQPADAAGGDGRQGRPVLPAGGPSVVGKRGDQRLPGGSRPAGPESSATGTDLDQRGSGPGEQRVSADPVPASAVDASSTRGTGEADKAAAQRAAAGTPVVRGDLANIREALPYLLPGQQEDVQKAETVFAKPTGYGMLFTNGTGTGKTFSGLGIIKRFESEEHPDALEQLIIVPDEKIGDDWMASGKPLALSITRLKDTKDAGQGIVITTLANLGQNDELARRNWRHVTVDEAHGLMQSAEGDRTLYLQRLQAITGHPDGVSVRTDMLHRDLVNQRNAAFKELDEASRDLNAASDDRARPALQAKLDKLSTRAHDLQRQYDAARAKVQAEVDAQQGKDRTRVTFLSATPFAYEKTVDWANGYLFDYNEGYPYKDVHAYNTPDPRGHFFIQHFGYRMRYGKLTEPDAKVDRGLMQRQFNGWLRKQGVLSSRMLDVAADYDRRFIAVSNAIGNRIDEALEWLSDSSYGDQKIDGMSAVRDQIADSFDYLTRRYLLEAIKAKEAVPIVKAHMALGRKVVVFHDYNKGGGTNPFNFEPVGEGIPSDLANKLTPEEKAQRLERAQAFNAAREAFRAQFPDLVGADFGKLASPIVEFRKSFGDELLLINGLEKRADVLKAYRTFQDDGSGPVVALVQADKNKGWSGHDTTGKHQRVLINLGLPTQPTRAIQQEGRIYRTGQHPDSHAIFRYLNTGTNWEKWAFATTIATRASAAENLSMGEQARALKDSYIAAFEEADAFPPGHEGEGRGGKERDKLANQALTQYDRAKAFYWGTQKKTSKTKAQEGKDYFATPEPIGLKMTEWAGVRGGDDVLEPSAGHGAIARWFNEQANRVAVEPSAALRSRLAMVYDGKIVEGTFEDHNVVNKYDAIVMNPPFGQGGKTAIDHLAKAATHLREDGRIVALIPQGPAADKRLEKFLYETPAQPLGTTAAGDYYTGDAVILNGGDGGRYTIEGKDERGIRLRAANGNVTSGWRSHYFGRIEPGTRTQASDLHLVADIALPQVTFERAGTAVATHIIVLQKGKAAENIQTRQRDYSDVDDIGQLFDRLQDLNLPERPEKAEAAQASPAQAATQVVPRATPAAQLTQASVPPVASGQLVTVTTASGKALRGVIRTDLSKDQAKAIDPYTWIPKGHDGWFIREKYLQGGNTAQEERAVYQVNEPQSSYDVDLFPDTLAKLEASSAAQPPRKGAKAQPAAPEQQLAPNVLAIREDLRLPGVFHVSSQLVQVGVRKLYTDRVTDWASAAQAFAAMARYSAEHFDMLVTDKDGKPLAVVGAFKGALTQTSVYPGTLLQEAVRIKGAAKVWAVHNHPSGNPVLSRADVGLSSTLSSLFMSTNIDYQGIAAVAPRDAEGGIEWTAEDADGFERSGSFAGGGQPQYGVPIVDREIVGNPRAAQAITSPSAAQAMAQQVSGGRSGLMALNAQSAMTAWIPMDVRALQQVGKPYERLVASLGDASAASVIVVDRGLRADAKMAEQRLTDFKRRMALNDIRVLDAVDPDDHFSMAEKGLLEPDDALQQYDAAALKAKTEREAAAKKAETTPAKPAAPAGRAPKVDQADLFNTQQSLFRQTDAQPLTPEQRRNVGELQQHVDAIAGAWTNAPRVTVVASVASPSVPHAVQRDAAAAMRAGGGRPQGVYYDGEVLLFADEIADPAEATKIVYHEVLGHYGLRGFFGADLDKVLTQVANLRGADVRAMIDRTGMDPADPASRLRAAEEVLAYLAQTKPDIGLVQKAIAAIRNFLRDHVPGFKNLTLSDNDIVQGFILPARGFIERGPGDGPRGGQAFAKGDSQAPFYSALRKQLEAIDAKTAPAAGWAERLTGLVNAGKVKEAEIEWSGVRDWLATQTGKVTKDQLLDFIQANGVRVEEVTKGADRDASTLQQLHAKLDSINVELTALGFEMRDEHGEAILHKRVNGMDFMFDPDTGDFRDEDGEPMAETDAAARDLAMQYGRTWDEIESYGGIPADPDATRYDKWTLPGGTNYREVLLTLPSSEKRTAADILGPVQQATPKAAAERLGFDDETIGPDVDHVLIYKPEGSLLYIEALKDGRFRVPAPRAQLEFTSRAAAERHLVGEVGYGERLLEDNSGDYRSSHWAEPNILAHIRLKDRTDADGKRVLFVEEIQSDWAQAGRKRGFQGAPKLLTGWKFRKLENGAISVFGPMQNTSYGVTTDRGAGAETEAFAIAEKFGGVQKPVPRAPFVEKTDAWTQLALKRIIKLAVDEGYDRVAFVNGTQSADRYSLEKHVDQVTAYKRPDGTFTLSVTQKGKTSAEPAIQVADASELEDTIGKEMAAQIVAQKDSVATYRSLDLKMGGEGMKEFYNHIIPSVLSKLVPKLGGAKLEDVQIGKEQPKVDVDWTALRADAKELAKGEMGYDEFRAAHDLTPEMAPDTELEALVNRDPYANRRSAETLSDFIATLRHRVAGSKALKQLGFTVTDKMREQAGGPLPLFSQKPSDIRFAQRGAESIFGPLSPQQEQALRNVGGIVKPQTLQQRFAEFKQNLGLRMKQGIVDQFAPIKDVDQQAYMLARLSKGADGTMEAALFYGKPFLRDGVPDVDVNGGGFAKVLAALKGEHDRFLWWVAANRAERLKREGRENLFTDQDISSLKTLATGQMADGTDRAAAYATALQGLNDYNDAVLAMAEGSGLIDPEARALFKDQPYVPFYRVMEDEGLQGPRFSSGLVNQTAWKKLKGGTSQLNDDLLSNMLMNWSHLYTAAARNRAAVATMDAAEAMAIAYPAQPGAKDSVRVMRDGVAQHYAIADPYLLDAVSALYYSPSPLMAPLSKMKKLLTFSVTVNPAFKVRNLLRDSISAMGQAELSYNPIKNVVQGWKASGHKTQTFASMMASGGLMRFGSLENSERIRAKVEKLGGKMASAGEMHTLKVAMENLWDTYNELGDKSENANRAALYEQLVKNGKSHAEAAYLSRDLMDFSMSGKWPLVRFLTQTVPFLNARIQGLYKLGRAAQENPRRFANIAAAVSLASLGLMMAYGDDEDWKKREDWDRDNYWWFKIGGTAFRIPKPFELGAIGTLAERTAELMFSKEMDSARFMDRIAFMVSQTFSLNPIPQALSPLVDVYANRDSFTRRPIENFSDEKLPQADRYDERTSELSRFLGQLGLPEPMSLLKGEYRALSPKQLDFLLQGYFSWMGASIAAVSDYAIRPVLDRGERPDRRSGVGFVQDLPAGQSRYVTVFYDQAKEVEQAFASYRQALREGDTDKAQRIVADGKVQNHVQAGHVRNRLDALNTAAKGIERDRTLTGAQKREKLNAIEVQREQIAQAYVTRQKP